MATPEEVKKAEEVKKLAEAKKVEAAKLAEVNKVKKAEEAEKAKEQKSPIVGRQATWAEIQNQQRGLTLDGKPRDK